VSYSSSSLREDDPDVVWEKPFPYTLSKLVGGYTPDFLKSAKFISHSFTNNFDNYREEPAIKTVWVMAFVRCEVCGRKIFGKPHKAVIEGAKLMVCGECVNLGSIYWEARAPQRRGKVIKPPPRISKGKPPPTITEDLELVDDFGPWVRQGREKLGLSHEDLGRRIGEKVSVLRKIESGKMVPNHILANKLEHALQVKLLVPISEPKVSSVGLPPPREVTLGERVHLKQKKTEVAEERKQS